MECEERKRSLGKRILLTLAVVQLWSRSTDAGPAMEGEFVAGSFILTQKSLNEAPYRDDDDRIDSSVLRSARHGNNFATNGTRIATVETIDRYAGVLRKALDKVETKDPPSKSDEENCSVRYRIRPSGE